MTVSTVSFLIMPKPAHKPQNPLPLFLSILCGVVIVAGVTTCLYIYIPLYFCWILNDFKNIFLLLFLSHIFIRLLTYP